MCDERHWPEGVRLRAEGTIQKFIISDHPWAGTSGWVTPGR